MIATSLFLMPNGTFFVELLVVLVILFMVTKFILPPLNKALEARQEKIRTALDAADQARADAAQADEARAKVLSDAREQARDIVANAQATSDQIKADSGARGQEEYDRILANAKSEVEAAKQRAIDEASAKIGDVVFELVGKIVGREVNAAAHEDLVREAVNALNAETVKGAKN
jgi:F-type H+-transporting ATPase subunit b